MARFRALAVLLSFLAGRISAQESKAAINAETKAAVVEPEQRLLTETTTTGDVHIDDLPMELRNSFVILTPLVSGAKNSARLEATPEKEAQVIISVYNDAGVPEMVLMQAQQEASRVFRHARIEVKWLNCRNLAAVSEGPRSCPESVYPRRLDLRIVRVPLNAKGDGMGISFLDDDARGCCADLFYGPMEELHKTKGTDLATLLGLVAAHEVGHLLLGTHSHSVAGIMHAHWTAQELARTRVGRLVFLDKESRRMRERLLSESPA